MGGQQNPLPGRHHKPAQLLQAVTSVPLISPSLQGLRWNCEPVSQHAFPRLRLQRRRHLVKLPAHIAMLPVTDPLARATPLAPEQWRAMLPSPGQCPAWAAGSSTAPTAAGQAEAAAQPQALSNSTTGHVPVSRGSISSAGPRPPLQQGARRVVLDVRNGYEWDAGHFQGAERPVEVQP